MFPWEPASWELRGLSDPRFRQSHPHTSSLVLNGTDLPTSRGAEMTVCDSEALLKPPWLLPTFSWITAFGRSLIHVMRIPTQLYEEVYRAMGRSFLPTASNDLVHIQVSAVKETLWTARASEDCHPGQRLDSSLIRDRQAKPPAMPLQTPHPQKLYQVINTIIL